MTSRSACEPLPKPTLSPFALARPGTFLRVGFFTAAVWCVPALRVPLVHSLINHFRKKKTKSKSVHPVAFSILLPISSTARDGLAPSVSTFVA